MQYINRVQRSEWLDLFADAGFELIDECLSYVDIHAVPIARQYALLSQEDLACIGMQVVHRRSL